MSEKGLQSLCITLGVMIIFWFVLISLFWVVIFSSYAITATRLPLQNNSYRPDCYDFFITDI